jgi:ketopantoate reductase
MIADDVPCSKIASELGNGLSENDIRNRWHRELKVLSGIIKPPGKTGPRSSITWTVDVDATIGKMRTDGISFAKIASELGNGLKDNDIKNRWNRHLKDKLQGKTGPRSSITWTADVDATIGKMRTDGISFAKIASELGNGLKDNDIKNRWNCHLKDKHQ